MLDLDMDPISSLESAKSKSIDSSRLKGYSGYRSSNGYKPGATADLKALMNGPIKKILKIIPPNVTYVIIFLFLNFKQN